MNYCRVFTAFLISLSMCVRWVEAVEWDIPGNWPSANAQDYPDRVEQEGITVAGKMLTPEEVERAFGAPVDEKVAKIVWIVIQNDSDSSFSIARAEGRINAMEVATALSGARSLSIGGNFWKVITIPRKIIAVPLTVVGATVTGALLISGPFEGTPTSTQQIMAYALSPLLALGFAGQWLSDDRSPGSRRAIDALSKRLSQLSIFPNHEEHPPHSSTHGVVYMRPTMTAEKAVIQLVTGSDKHLTFRLKE